MFPGGRFYLCSHKSKWRGDAAEESGAENEVEVEPELALPSDDSRDRCSEDNDIEDGFEGVGKQFREKITEFVDIFCDALVGVGQSTQYVCVVVRPVQKKKNHEQSPTTGKRMFLF